ncbi:hypothetical protein HGRIS_011842 [Hohenbuehelia grisea]|uniref:Uncharacterized protein n=1 Tax=Hohenbuehelia grisea TaxID=104357 RepID=A0ABR3JX45_9AGAR
MLKDYDTFTEGTAKGSFDSIPIGSTDQFGDPFPSLDIPTVESLPVADVSRSIERWRDDVSQCIPDTSASMTHEYEYFDDDDFYAAATPTKRPRSITSDDGARRTRLRPHSMVASTQPLLAHGISHDATFAAPMLVDAPGPSRPRAQSAPPNKGGEPNH